MIFTKIASIFLNSLFKFIDTSKFPQCKDTKFENNKIGLLRITLGGIVFIRTLIIMYTSFYYYPKGYNLLNINFSIESLFSIISCLLVFMFTIGFFTPVACLVLLFFYPTIDLYLGTGLNLGTCIFSTTLIFYFLTNNKNYTIDSILIIKNNMLAKCILKIYSFIGAPSLNNLRLFYFFLFISYALISFGALQYHLNDSYWTTGKTVAVLMANSYLNKFYELFRLFERNFPHVYSIFSIMGVIFQSIFQLLMIPLMWLRFGRYFVALYGLWFISISVIFLEISYLPFVEIIVWSLIFFRPHSTQKISIIYDDYCNLCSKNIKFLNFINISDIFNFSPLSKSENLLRQYNINKKDAFNHMHGVVNEKIYTGFDLYLAICRNHPLLIVLYPCLYLLKITRIGYSIYNYIAKYRYRLFGSCKIELHNARNNATNLPEIKPLAQQSHLYVSAVSVFIILIFTLFIFTFPWTQNYLKWEPPQFINKTFFYAGLVIPNVFNARDLSMGNTYPVIYRVLQNTRTMVPFNGMEGQRLYYHLSDTLYFGNSLRWRRSAINSSELACKPESDLYSSVSQIILFDYNFNSSKESIQSYQVDIFQNLSSIISEKDLKKRYSSSLICSFSAKIPP